MSGRGLFVVSIDLELAWGTCDRALTAAGAEALARERDIVAALLELFACHGVRATWAVVGHLLRARCEPGAEPPHPALPRAAGPLWYAADLVEAIRRARPPQEIASHSFAHGLFDAAVTPARVARADIAAARRVHAEAGVPFESWVFPRNMAGHLDALAAAGVRAYRGHPRRWYHALPGRRLGRLGDLAAFLLATPRVVRPRVDGWGMVDVPASLLLYSRRGPARLLSPPRVVERAGAALERAAATGGVFHLWFHPANFVARTAEQLAILDGILTEARRLRDAGRLAVLPMRDVWRVVAASAGTAGAPA